MSVRESIVVVLFAIGILYKLYQLFLTKKEDNRKYDYLLIIIFLVGILNIVVK